MRLKLLILRWIDDRGDGDGDGDGGNNPPVPSRLQFLKGLSWGWTKRELQAWKRIDERGGRKRKKSTRPKLAR